MSRSITLARSLAALGCGTVLAGTAAAQTTLYDLNGSANNQRLGASVASAGDLNGDGASEILVGIPEDANVFNPGTGKARVYDGASGNPMHTWDGDVLGDGFGTSVDGGFDVNNDGTPDVLVGAPFHTNVFQADGQLRVLSGLDYSPIVTVHGTASLQQLGRQVSMIGDLNADGRAEFMTGSFSANNDKGLVRVYTFNGFNATQLYQFQGSSNGARLGLSMDSIGDVNLDGVRDILLGSAYDGYYVISGLTGAVLRHTTIGSEPTLGTSIASIADISGDGVDDIVVSAIQADIFAPGPGRVYVKNGATDQTLFTINGAANGDAFGLQVADAGDWNGDGLSDIMVTSDPAAGASFVTIHSGQNGALLTTLLPDSPTDNLGAAIAGLGDLNADGKVEVIAGAPEESSVATLAGLARVYSSPFSGCGNIVQYCGNATTNSTGSAANIAGIGNTSVSAGQFILQATNLPAGVFGLFYYGPNQVNTPVGDGIRCVGGATFRLAPSQASAQGSVLKDLFSDGNSGAISGAGTWNFQFWYRDIPGGPAGFNFSKAMTVNFCD